MRIRKFLLSLLAILMCAALLASCGETETVKKKKKKKKKSNKATSSDVVTDNDNSSDNISSDIIWVDDTDYSNDWDDTSDYDDEEDETKIPIPEIVPEGNTANLMCDVKGGAETEADKLREEILNTKSDLKITGTTYYISSENGDDNNDGTSPETAWKTTDQLTLNAWKFVSGDGVLFERGGIYRTSSPIGVKSGMSYGAYGTGAKPVIYGSVENYAQPDYWTPSKKENVWVLNLPLESAGIVVFNHGESVGRLRSGLLAMEQNGDFYHNSTDGLLYLYLDEGRPNQVYYDIEIGTRRSIFQLSRKVKNVVIDNICMKYVGNFCVQAIGDNANVTVTNCEMGWVGGSLQEDGKESRYGNAVQFWDSANNITCDHNWVYQVYDAGLTFQGSDGSIYENISFSDNLIEYCSYGIEFFTKNHTYGDTNSTSVMKNIDMNNNIIRLSGYGWGEQRPDHSHVSAINGWDTDYKGIQNFNIKNNIFDLSNYNLIYWRFGLANVNLSGNTYYQRTGVNDWAWWVSNNTQLSATDQTSFEEAIKAVDTSAKTIKWLS